MTASTQLEAFADCLELFDTAIAAPKGIDYGLGTYADAFRFMQRLHSARKLDRERARELREPSDPLFGVSPYDTLVVRSPRQLDGKWWLRIEPRSLAGEVKEIA